MESEDSAKRSHGQETQGSKRTTFSSSQPQEVSLQPQSGAATEKGDEWRDRALRLQADMENYRKRQQRLADERILEEREKLLRNVLTVVDDLERALGAQHTDVSSLRQGVGMTYQAFMQILGQEDVEQIEAQGQPFDPEYHEAVGTVPVSAEYPHPQTIVQVLRPGYRFGNRLLRPARVLVST